MKAILESRATEKLRVRLFDWEAEFTRQQLNESQVQAMWGELEALARKTLGSSLDMGFLSRESMCAHARTNPEAVVVHLRQGVRESKVYGLTVLLALRRDAVRGLLRGEISSGHELSEEDILPSFDDASGIYFAGVYGDGARARAAVLVYVREKVAEISEGKRTVYVFGRATTAASKLRLPLEGFRRLNPRGRSLFYRTYPEGLPLHERVANYLRGVFS